MKTSRVQLAVLLMIVGLGVGVAMLTRGAGVTDADRARNAPTVVTVSLASLPSEVSAMYLYAADHAEHYTTIPCYCGCDRSLAHRNLKDCFVTPDGDWDAHASGCGVCTAESTTAKELFDSGIGATAVRQQVIDRYGPSPVAQQGAKP